MRQRSAIVLLMIFVLSLFIAVLPSAAQDAEIVWAFVPSSDSETVLAGASALTDLIAEKTGIQITPVVATDYSGVIEAMCNGEAANGALNTFSYILAQLARLRRRRARLHPLRFRLLQRADHHPRRQRHRNAGGPQGQDLLPP